MGWDGKKVAKKKKSECCENSCIPEKNEGR
jgi:hypothetical protein